MKSEGGMKGISDVEKQFAYLKLREEWNNNPEHDLAWDK